MKSKLVEAGKPIEVEIPASLGGAGGKKLSLTILEEIGVGKDRRVYKVKDQYGVLYVYKYMKKRTLQKEISRAEAVVRSGVPSAALVTSGRDGEERSNGYVLRAWVEGTRGDAWLQQWASFGAPMGTFGVQNLLLLLDTLSRQGKYIGGLDPEDLIFVTPLSAEFSPVQPGWVIVNCGSTREMAPRAAADRYFWKFIERWGTKLDRQSEAFTNFFNLLTSLGKDFPTIAAAAVEVSKSSGSTKVEDEDEDDETDGEDEEDEDDEDDEDKEVPTPPAPVTVMDFKSAYPTSVGTPSPEGYRGGSYERLKDGTERINGKVVPADSLWLAILKDHPELRTKRASEAHSFLREAGFPEHIIDEFLAHSVSDQEGIKAVITDVTRSYPAALTAPADKDPAFGGTSITNARFGKLGKPTASTSESASAGSTGSDASAMSTLAEELFEEPLAVGETDNPTVEELNHLVDLSTKTESK